MAHKTHILLATATVPDGTRVREHIQAACQRLALKKGEEYVITVCPNVNTLRNMLTSCDEAKETVLVVTEPYLTDLDYVVPLIMPLVARNPQSVILIKRNRLRLHGLRMPESQIIRSLNASALQRMEQLVRHFLKDDLEHGLEDYNRFALELDNLKRDSLSPLSPEAAPAREDVSGADVQPAAADIKSKWDELANQIARVAMTNLQEAIQGGASPTDRTPLLGLVHAMLHLWVETRLYGLRAESNYFVYHTAHDVLVARRAITTLERIPPGFGIDQKARKRVREEVSTIIQEYQSRLHAFDDLAGVSGILPVRFFTRHPGDAEQFRSWSDMFGPDIVSPEHEPGWDVHAAEASQQLYYQYRKALQHENWRVVARWPSAFILWVYEVVAGYGMKPGRAALVAVSAFGGFALAQFADDSMTACSSVPATASLGSVIQYYIAVSISSLTSLGSVPTPCGNYHGLLLSAETITGYFLLAVLTTLFVQSLLDR